MNNKVYGFCPAGCRYEVVKKTDIPTKFVYLTETEYKQLTKFEDDVLYFVYDEEIKTTMADDSYNVCKTIGNESLENIFTNIEYYADGKISLADGEVRKATLAKRAERADYATQAGNADRADYAEGVIAQKHFNSSNGLEISKEDGVKVLDGNFTDKRRLAMCIFKAEADGTSYYCSSVIYISHFTTSNVPYHVLLPLGQNYVISVTVQPASDGLYIRQENGSATLKLIEIRVIDTLYE